MRLRDREIAETSQETQVQPINTKIQQPVKTTDTPSKTPLSVEGADFLRNLITKTEDSRYEIGSVEIARFRLLSMLITRAGNDKPSLGVHDANLLFANKSQYTFGHAEISALFICGLQHYSSENVPLWHWYAKMTGFKRHRSHGLLSLYSVAGSSEAGAISAMRLIAEPLADTPPLDRQYWLSMWLNPKFEVEVRLAALRYLADFGVTADVPAIKEELDRSNTQTTAAAIEAIIHIALRDSREKALS